MKGGAESRGGAVFTAHWIAIIYVYTLMIQQGKVTFTWESAFFFYTGILNHQLCRNFIQKRYSETVEEEEEKENVSLSQQA